VELDQRAKIHDGRPQTEFDSAMRRPTVCFGKMRATSDRSTAVHAALGERGAKVKGDAVSASGCQELAGKSRIDAKEDRGTTEGGAIQPERKRISVKRRHNSTEHFEL